MNTRGLWRFGIWLLSLCLAVASAAAQAADKVTVVDVLVVYTSTARAGAGRPESIQSQIRAAMAEANLVLQNSQVDARLHLVGTTEVDYEETGVLSKDLARLRDPGDGYLDQVLALRDHHAADLVCLITETGEDKEFCGLPGPSIANAFSVIRRPFLVGNYYLPVVLSFNFGCQLERSFAERTGAFPYAYGYTFSTGSEEYSTIESLTGTRLPFFSNPRITFQGVAMGKPAGVPYAADNARVLSISAPIVAAFRDPAPKTIPPAVHWVEPTNGYRLRENDPVAVGAAASDEDGMVVRVDFYVNQTCIVTSTNAPFECIWTNASLGPHVLRAIAIDDLGAMTVSTELQLTVYPANDNFADAIVLQGTNVSVSGTTQGASLEAGEDDIGGTSVWFVWTAPASGKVTVNVPETWVNDSFAAYSGNSVESLTRLAANFSCEWWDWCIRLQTMDFQARRGEVFHIKVDGMFPGSGNFTLALSLQPAPANDDFANATVLQGTLARVDGSCTGATVEPGEPEGGAPSIWYSYRAPFNGRFWAFGLEGSLGLGFGAYVGESVSNLVAIGSKGYGNGNGIFREVLGFDVVAGTTYYIRVTGSAPQFGFSITLEPTAGNDSFENRLLLATGPSVTGNNRAATLQAGEADEIPDLLPGAQASHRTVWWTWTAASKGEALFNLYSGFPSVIKIYAGSILTNLQLVGWGLSAVDPLSVLPGTTLQIAVDGVNGAAGDFALGCSFTPSPTNDSFAEATRVSDSDITLSGSTEAATSEVGEPCHMGTCDQGSIWWTWTAPLSGYVSIYSATNTTTTTLAVYTGSALANLTLVGQAINGEIDFEALEGTEYHIAASDFGSSLCEFILALSTVRITEPVSSFRFTNGCDLPITATVTPNEGRVVRLDFFQNGTLLGSSANSPFHLLLTNVLGGVYTLTVVATSDTGLTHRSPPVVVAVRPINDDFADAAILTNYGSLVTGSNFGATTEPGEPASDRSIWWSWTATGTGRVRLEASASMICSLFQVFTGSTVSNLVCKAAFSPWYGYYGTSGEFEVVEGEVYHVSFSSGCWSNEGQVQFALTFESSPANDHFANRSALEGGSLWMTNNIGAASLESEEPGYGVSDKSIWWSWTAARSGQVTLQELGTCGSSTLTVYTGDALSNLTEVVSGSACVRFSAVEGTTYQIQDRTANCQDLSARATLRLETMVPVNDHFKNRVFISGVPLTVSNNNFNASSEPGEQKWLSPGRTLWWAWTSTNTGMLTISTVGSSSQPWLAVFSGTNLTNLAYLAGNGGGWWEPPSESMRIKVRAGQTYAISADEDDSVGDIVLNFVGMAATPMNDDFADRSPLWWAHTGISAFLANASVEPGEPAAYFGHTAWWNWTAPVTGGADVWTADQTIGISVYTGSALTNLTPLAYGSPALFRAVAGSNYIIRVDGPEGFHQVFLDAFAAPANDFFTNRLGISGTNLTLAGVSFGATHEPGEPQHGPWLGTGSAWWSWKAPANGCLLLSPGSAFTSPIWAVYLGETLTNLTSVAVGMDQPMRVRVEEGLAYQIVEDYLGWPQANSSWTLTFAPGPPNDDFRNATVLMGMQPSISPLLANATLEPGEPKVSDRAPLASVWYSWTAAASGAVSINSSNMPSSCFIGVFKGNEITNLSAVVSPGSPNVVFAAQSGITYRILLQSSDPAPDILNLGFNFTPSPPNDFFADRIFLAGTTATTNGTMQSATSEPGEPDQGAGLGGHSVWYSWTAPTSGLLTVSAIGSSSNPLLKAFTGENIANLDPVCEGSATLAFSVEQGITYQLALDTEGNNNDGAFTLALNLEPSPANDHFAHRVLLSGFKATGGGKIGLATSEPGEPHHAGVAAAHSLWWSWTSPADGLAQIRVDSPLSNGAVPQGQMAVYLGSELSNLTEVALAAMPSLIFRVSAGTAYQIALDSGAFGVEPLGFTLELPKAPIISPTNGQRFVASADILIIAQPLDIGAAVQIVDFFVGGNILASVSNAPFHFMWTNVAAGRYTLSTRATDESGEVTTSTAIEIIVQPANDDFASRLALAGTSGRIAVNLIAATLEAGEPLLASATGKTLWWSWTAPANGVLTITTIENQFPSPLDQWNWGAAVSPNSAMTVIGEPATEAAGLSITAIRPPSPPPIPNPAGNSGGPAIAIYSGSVLSSLNFRTNNLYYYAGRWYGPPYSGWRALPDLTLPVQAGQVYQMSVDGLNGSVGAAVLDYIFIPDPPSPPNDNFAGRQLMEGSSVALAGSTVSATREPEERNHGVEGSLSERTVWYSWKARGTGTVTVSSEQNSVGIAVYAGSGLGDLEFIAGGQMHAAFEALAGMVYQVVVFTSADTQISFNLSLQGPPPPPALHNVALEPAGGGCPHLQIVGNSGQSFAVQASTDLVHWETVLIDTVVGDRADYVDTDAGQFLYRFYRVLPLEAIFGTGNPNPY